MLYYRVFSADYYGKIATEKSQKEFLDKCYLQLTRAIVALGYFGVSLASYSMFPYINYDNKLLKFLRFA